MAEAPILSSENSLVHDQPGNYEVDLAETLELFNNPEVRESARRAIDLYPEASEFPYHNRQHALNIINSTNQMVEILKKAGRKISPDEQQAMLLAAAWHDAGFGDEAAKNYDSKEVYAEELFNQDVSKFNLPISIEQRVIVHEAIAGTDMAKTSKERTFWGKLMHYSDVSYLFDKPVVFAQHALEYYDEECSYMDWSSFRNHENRFLTFIVSGLTENLAEIGFDEQFIDACREGVKNNWVLVTGESVKSREDLLRVSTELSK